MTKSNLSAHHYTREMTSEKTKRITFRGPESPLVEAIMPIVYPIRIFGLAPYTFKGDRLVPSNINQIYSVIWFGIYTYIIIHYFIRTVDDTDLQRSLLGVTEKGKMSLNYFWMTVDMFITAATRHRFSEVFNSIQDFDENVRSLNYPRRETITKYCVRFILFGNLILWTAINQIGVFAWNEPYIQNVTYMILYLGAAVSVVKFSCMVLLFGQRFRQLNQIAREFTAASASCRETSLQNMKKIIFLHRSMMDTCDKLNSIYFWLILGFLLNLCVHGVCDMYFFVVKTILDPTIDSTETRGRIGACLLLWLSNYIIQLILLHVSCHLTASEANKMAYILLNWRRQLYELNVKDNDIGSLMYMLNNRLGFSAGGCFNINLRLLTSASGLLTIYLVILLQLPDHRNKLRSLYGT